MGKRSRRKRPGRGAATTAGGAARTAAAAAADTTAVAVPTLAADQHRVTVAERQRRNRERGEPRAEADCLMQKFLSLRNEDPWNFERLSAFDSLGKIMLENSDKFDFESIQVYIKFLKKIRRSKTEPAFYRASAYETTGCIDIRNGPDVHGEALDYFENAISIYESADASEKGRIVCLHGNAIRIGDYYEHRISFITKLVFSFHEKYCVGAWGPTGCDIAVAVPAGLQCECCEESRKEIGKERLRQCGRCKMAYYCSVDCQQKAWREQGHRLVCRKKGEFKVGDVAVLTKSVGGIHSGQPVELIAPVLDDLGTNDEGQSRWLVKESQSPLSPKEKKGDERVKVAVQSLKPVRSALWRAWTKEDIAQIEREVLERDRNTADEEDVPLPELLSNNDCKEDLDSDDDDDEKERMKRAVGVSNLLALRKEKE